MKHTHLIVITQGIVAFFVISLVLQQFQGLFLPLALAVLLTILFQPVVLFLQSKQVPTGLSLLAVLSLLGVSIYLLGFLLFASAGGLINDLPTYETQFAAILTDLFAALVGVIQNVGFQVEDIDIRTALGATTITAEALSSALGSFLDYLGKVALVLLFMLFMLAGTGTLRAKMYHAYSRPVADRIMTALAEINTQVRRYLVLKVIIGAVYGVVALLVLWMLGVHYPLFWGFLAFLLSFIPYVGSLLAVGLPFMLSLLQFDTPIRPLLVLLILGAAFTVMGNVVTPKLMASSLNLSTLLVLVAMIFWGLLWGPWGIILAVPLTATLKTIFENIEVLRPLSLLMRERIDAGE